jgi:uncharacterized membrane protein
MTTPDLQRAKRPRTALAGPYGHPFHPVLVTVPIGAWTASVLFDLAARVSDSNEGALSQGAYWLIGIGIVGAALAALFGLHDLSLIARSTPAYATGLTHMGLNVVALALFVVDFLIRRSDGPAEPNGTALVLSLIALAVVGASGWLGGKLSYHYGVRVADEATQSEGFVQRG